MSKILENTEALKTIKTFNIKNLILGHGHDGGGLVATLCYGRQKLLYYNDDGWGGEATIRYENAEAEAMVKKVFKELDIKELAFNNGYDFYKDGISGIDFDTEITFVIEALASDKEWEKHFRKSKSKFMFGTKRAFQFVGWTGIKDLSEMPLKDLQECYNECKSELKEGGAILNSKEQLLALGIEL